MQLSASSAILYQKPFELVMQIIAEAGFQNIELDLFWERKEWAMAQHLRDVPIKRVIRMIEDSGLRISSIHDGGGVLEDNQSTNGFINPTLDEYLSEMAYQPDCLVFHTPHIEGNPGTGWWEKISAKIVDLLDQYRKACTFITLENLPTFDGYFVPLTLPEALNTFLIENRLGATLDTTHYAQIGIDIINAAEILGGRLKTIHMSDYKAAQAHVFIGEGELDLPGFFEVIDIENLNAVTLESTLMSQENPDRVFSFDECVSRMKTARLRMENLVLNGYQRWGAE